MEKTDFRLLRADEIDCRIATVKATGLSLLLYKDARVDQNILDEAVGPMNWQRRHCRDNANCIVSLWDKEKAMWIEKEDTGTESYTEKEKGLASDSFKRACFNWGIGRELYTAPFVWVGDKDCKIAETTDPRGNKKYTCYDNFYVSSIGYDDNRNISELVIKHSKSHKVVYKLGQVAEEPAPVESVAKETKNKKPAEPQAPQEPAPNGLTTAQVNTLYNECGRTGTDWKRIVYTYHVKTMSEMNINQFRDAMDKLKIMADKEPEIKVEKAIDPATIPPDDMCGLPFN